VQGGVPKRAFRAHRGAKVVQLSRNEGEADTQMGPICLIISTAGFRGFRGDSWHPGGSWDPAGLQIGVCGFHLDL
jgi:hypothetical protein